MTINGYSNLSLGETQQKANEFYRSAPRCVGGYLYLLVIALTSACTQSPRLGYSEPVSTQTEPVNVASVLETETPLALVTPTTKPLQSPVVTSIPTTISTPTSVSSTAIVDITGRILLADDIGIQEVLLPNGNSRYLIRKGSDWTEWGASFGQNNDILTYWMVYEGRREVWVTPLQENWQPKRIMAVEDDFDAWSMGNWTVNDRYLLTSAATLDESSLLEDYTIVRTFIYDTQSEEVVAEPYWPGSCMILAPSPRTQQLALWCSQSDDAGHPQYLVLEPETNPWVTEQIPHDLFEDCHPSLCAWSADGNYVAYISSEHVPESLYYSTIETPLAVHLKDDLSDFLYFPLWSPNSEYILYYGSSLDSANRYMNTLAIEDSKVKRRAPNTKLGVEYRELAIWSPDSRYVARAAFSFLEDKNLIILEDIIDGREVGRIDRGLNPTTDMIWVDGLR